VSDQLAKFDRLAAGYSAHEYADPALYAARRAEVATRLGPALQPGASVVDLACGDGNMAPPLQALGLRYRGVDGSAAMIAEARARLGPEAELDIGLIGEYEPAEPADLTLFLRTLYRFDDRTAVFRWAAGFTRVKLVFDFDPRVQSRQEILAELRAAGFARAELTPFLLPQRVAVPRAIRPALYALERTGPIARAALHVRGIWFCAAYPGLGSGVPLGK
jgi:SAM-dependent methyltransferase